VLHAVARGDSRGRVLVAACERRQPGRTVDRRQADEAVYDAGRGVRLAEVEAEDPGHEIELRDGDETPIEPTDDEQ